MELNEQQLMRRQALEEMRQAGIDPFPAELFEVNASAKEILMNYENNKVFYKNVSIAGRIMTRRIMGKASFAVLQDASGRIQIYLNRDEICPDEDKTTYNSLFKKWMDIGDLIGVTGHVFTTQTGEISIHVKEIKMLAK